MIATTPHNPSPSFDAPAEIRDCRLSECHAAPGPVVPSAREGGGNATRLGQLAWPARRETFDVEATASTYNGTSA